MQIRAVTTVIIDVPLKRLQRFSAIGARSQSVVIIRIKTDDGLEGVGEAVTPSGPWWGGESVESIKSTIDTYYADLLSGQDPLNRTELIAKLTNRVYGNPFALAGVEMALLDLAGKYHGVPLSTLLGGQVRSALPCSWPLASNDAHAEIDEAKGMIEAGKHNIFKMKMGSLPPAEDVKRAVAVIEGLRDIASVRADPNERWDEETAKWAIPRLEDAGIDMIEQPIARWNHKGAARITERSKTAIMADESVCSVQDMITVAGLRSADLVSLKIMKSGGIEKTRTIAEIAEAAGVSLYMGTFLETSLGTAANMQLCATFAHLPYGGELSGPGLIAEDITTEPAVYKDFALQMPSGVGIGAELDEDKIAAFTRGRTRTIQTVTKSVSATA